MQDVVVNLFFFKKKAANCKVLDAYLKGDTHPDLRGGDWEMNQHGLTVSTYHETDLGH